MFTALTILGLAAATALALWLLSRKKSQDPDPLLGANTPQEQQEILQQRERERICHEARKGQLIDEIADRIKFSTAPVVLNQVKVGEREVPSPYPADSIDVRPLHNVAEMQRMLGVHQAVDDEVFYGQLAARQILVTEDMARVDVIDDVVGVPVNMLVVLQDVSPSMREYSRISWAITLNRKLLNRGLSGKAIYRLLRFDFGVRKWLKASTKEEYEKLVKNMPQYLQLGNGTDIDNVLKVAFSEFEESEASDRKLVLITDGTQDVDTSFATKRLRQLEIELHIVCIGKDNRSLRSIAHHYDLFPD